jgi:hypothetical protein
MSFGMAVLCGCANLQWGDSTGVGVTKWVLNVLVPNVHGHLITALNVSEIRDMDIYIYIYISYQLDVTFIKIFQFIFATLHVSGVPCPSSGVSLLHW